MKKYFDYFVICFAFFFSYTILLFTWSLFLNSLLVPWDATIVEDRPPLGSISRTINDYFEQNELYPVLLLVASLIICIIHFIKKYKQDPILVLIHTAVTNILYVAVVHAVLIIYIFFDYSEDFGYRPLLLGINILLIGILFYAQITEYTPKRN